MSLNVASNYTARINPSAIDTNAIKDITNQIFNAEAKSVDLDSLDLTKFNRVDQGTDLYSKATKGQQATQIAVRNAGIDVKLNQNFISNVQYLNSHAAVNATKAVSEQVNGKLTLPVNSDAQVSAREIFALPAGAQVIESQNLSKDKRGSNPFSYQNPAATQEETENVVDALNIFA